MSFRISDAKQLRSECMCLIVSLTLRAVSSGYGGIFLAATMKPSRLHRWGKSQRLISSTVICSLEDPTVKTHNVDKTAVEDVHKVPTLKQQIQGLLKAFPCPVLSNSRTQHGIISDTFLIFLAGFTDRRLFKFTNVPRCGNLQNKAAAALFTSQCSQRSGITTCLFAVKQAYTPNMKRHLKSGTEAAANRIPAESLTGLQHYGSDFTWTSQWENTQVVSEMRHFNVQLI